MTDQITEAELAEIEALEAVATPAPWGFANGTTIVRGLEVTGRGSYRCISSVAEVTDEDDRELWDEHDDHLLVDPEHDGELIVALRNAWPRLVAALRAAYARLHEYESAICFEVTCTGCAKQLDALATQEADHD